MYKKTISSNQQVFPYLVFREYGSIWQPPMYLLWASSAFPFSSPSPFISSFLFSFTFLSSSFLDFISFNFVFLEKKINYYHTFINSNSELSIHILRSLNLFLHRYLPELSGLLLLFLHVILDRVCSHNPQTKSLQNLNFFFWVKRKELLCFQLLYNLIRLLINIHRKCMHNKWPSLIYPRHVIHKLYSYLI